MGLLASGDAQGATTPSLAAGVICAGGTLAS